MFIYCITNKINNKVYIGKSVKSAHLRWNQHKKHAENGSTLYIHSAIRKHGIENFIFEIIDNAINKEELADLEKYHIYLAGSFDRNNGYNLTKGGEGGRNKYIKGSKTSEETKKKMSDSHKLLTPHENSLKALRDNPGHKYSTPETREKVYKQTRKIVKDDKGNTFDGLQEAAKFYGFNKNSIAMVANGKRTSLFGIKFYYARKDL